MRSPALYRVLLFLPAVLGAQTIHYAPRASALLDLYSPATTGPYLTILAVHGGGWSAGTRADTAAFCRIMVQSGYACAALDYRLAPANHLSAQIEDIKAAIVCLAARRQTARIVLAGESAGGHLVSYFGAQHPLSVAGVIAFSAPQDLIALAKPGRALGIIPPELHDLLGVAGWDEPGIKALRDASPINNIRPGVPPILLIHGDADRLVPISQSRAFCAALGNEPECQLHIVHDARHGLWSDDQVELYAPDWRVSITRWIAREITNRSATR